MIRPVEAGDIDAITGIYRQAVIEETGTFEIDPPDASEMTARHARIVGSGHPYLVATDGSTVLGYAYAGPYHQRPAYRFSVEDSVYVAAAGRGRGIGAQLLDALIVETTARGFRQMVAVIGDSGNERSVRLHARAGFVPVGILRNCGWKQDRWLDVVFMQRALGEGSLAPAT